MTEPIALVVERAIREFCRKSPGFPDLSLSAMAKDIADALALRSVTEPVDLLDRLVDWAYLHATEGQTWPSTKTKTSLILRARQYKPIQGHAEEMKAAAPSSPAPNKATQNSAERLPSSDAAGGAGEAIAEECAKIAEGHVGNSSSEDACSVSGYDEACRDIAKAIRDAHGARE